MAAIPFVPQEDSLGHYDHLRLAEAQPNQALATAEGFLETQAQHDAAIEGLNTLSNFKVAQDQRRQQMQAASASPEGFTPKAQADFDEQSQKLLSAQTNPRVAQFLQDRLPQAKDENFAQSVQWEQGQRQSLRETQFSQSLSTLANGVTSNPAQFGSALSDVNAALAHGQFEPAQRAKLMDAAGSTLAKSYISGVTGQNPQAALDQLNNGSLDKYLTPDEKLSAVGRATAALKFRDVGASQDAVDLANSSIQSITDTGKHLAPELEAQIGAGLTPREFARYQSRVQKADQVFRATGDMSTLNPADMQGRVESLKPQGGEADFQDKEAAYASALQRMTQVMQARRSDPGAAVRQAFPEVEGAWQAYASASGADQPKMLQAALKASGTAQSALGIPISQQRLLPDQIAQGIAGQIKGAPPEKAAQILQQTETQFGSYWPQAFKQMSKMLDPAAKVAATIEDSADGALLLETSRQNRADVMRATDAKQADFNTAISSDQRVKDLTFSLSQRQGGSGTASDIADAIQTLALGRMRTKGEDQATATEAAIKTIVDAKYNFNYQNGLAYRIPKGFDQARIDDGAKAVQSNLAPEGIDVPATMPGTLKADTLKTYLDNVRRTGFWVTNDDETGVILYNERGVPVTRGGKPIEQKFQDLQSMPIEAPNPFLPAGVGGPDEPNPAQANADLAPLASGNLPGESQEHKWQRWDRSNAAAGAQANAARAKADAAPELQTSGEQWASRGPGDQAAPVAATRDNTSQINDLLTSMQRDYDSMHATVRQMGAGRVRTQQMMELSTKELGAKLAAAGKSEDRTTLITELSSRAEDAKPAARREILKQLDDQWSSATVTQKMMIMRLHLLDARDRAPDLAASIVRGVR